MILVVLAIVILGIVLVCADGVHSAKQIKPAIERKTYGKGTRTEELDIRIGSDDKGKTEKIRSKVEISERRYTEKEVQELFDRIIRRMDRMIQGENETLEHVDHDLDLMTEVPGEPVKIRWILDRYDVMNRIPGLGHVLPQCEERRREGREAHRERKGVSRGMDCGQCGEAQSEQCAGV